MDDVDDFLEFYRPQLLSYLDSKVRNAPEELGPLEFVDKVLDDWLKFSQGRTIGKPSSKERTFWFALYQLEELVENPVTGQLDPYEGMLMQNLAVVRELLREWQELPDGFHATRPGEDQRAL